MFTYPTKRLALADHTSDLRLCNLFGCSAVLTQNTTLSSFCRICSHNIILVLQDLLTTVNTPEWPAAELLLSVLGRLLVSKFANKGISNDERQSVSFNHLS
jgi:hypothetical protein